MMDFTDDMTEVLKRLPHDTSQAIMVRSSGDRSFSAQVTAWEMYRKEWKQCLPAMWATIGRNGWVSTEDKCEGDGCTPTGIYYLGLAFGSEATNCTALPYRQTREEDCWVDDPDSDDYNCWVKGKPDAQSWEEMRRPDGLYRYGIVVDYNTAPVIPGKGSAIFMHLWRGPDEPTAGCVALAEPDLLQLMTWLDPKKRPVVILGKI